MKKRITLITLVLMFALALTACGCKHETWVDADCLTPKTCAECGQTEGEALGHSWVDADCVNAKTCSVCGAIEGEALGHDWADATCVEAKTCARCGEVEGEALGHSWLEATTEAPKTCEVCEKTEGEKIITDARFTTAANQHLFGKWTGEVQMPGSALGAELAPYVDVLDCIFHIEFRNDGTMCVSFSVKDEQVLQDAMNAYTVDLMYQQFAISGIDAATANEAMKSTYGMTVEEYVAAEVAKMDMNELLASAAVEYCYYVDGETIYMGTSWNDLSPDSYTLEGDTLYIPLEGQEDVPFSRVTE